MDVLREEFTQAFEGPLAEVAGLPTGLLYAIVLTVAHVAGRGGLDRILTALRPVLGEPRKVRKGLFNDRLEYGPGLPATVKVGKGSLQVAVGRRLKSQRVEELIGALARVPGARDLRVVGERRVFQEPGASAGPPME